MLFYRRTEITHFARGAGFSVLTSTHRLEGIEVIPSDFVRVLWLTATRVTHD